MSIEKQIEEKLTVHLQRKPTLMDYVYCRFQESLKNRSNLYYKKGNKEEFVNIINH